MIQRTRVIRASGSLAMLTTGCDRPRKRRPRAAYLSESAGALPASSISNAKSDESRPDRPLRPSTEVFAEQAGDARYSNVITLAVDQFT